MVVEIDWGALEHFYGEADDVPAMLRDGDVGALSDVLVNQGGAVLSAATAALPSLVAMAADPGAAHRVRALGIVGDLAREAQVVEMVDEGWPAALERRRPALLALLDDADPAVRRTAAWVVSGGVRHPGTAAAVLARWDVERDRVARWDLVRALGDVREWSDDDRVEPVLRGLLTDDDLHLRLAAAHALGDAGDVDSLIAAVRHEDLALWAGSPWGSGRSLVRATGLLVSGDPVSALAYAVGLDGAVDRADTVREVSRVTAEWRAAGAAAVPFLVSCLDDADVRFQAVMLLGCLAPGSAPHADRLAEVAEGTGRAADAAVWALARLRDPRCLPGIESRLTGEHLGFATASSHTGRNVPPAWVPSVDEVLTPLAEHADRLAPALAARLARTTETSLALNLFRVVRAWGDKALPALPALVPFLDVPDLRPHALTALGALGAPAADAVRDVAPEESAEAAWAHWRTGVEPDRAADALTAHFTAKPDDHNTHLLLADLGPRAAHLADALAALDDPENPWPRTGSAYAHWRVTGTTDHALRVLTAVAGPLATGAHSPVAQAAWVHLAAIGSPTPEVLGIARAVAANPRRVTDSGAWHSYQDDETVRACAERLLG